MVDVDARHRAVLELRRCSACSEVCNKRKLALYLEATGVSAWAPQTFLHPSILLSNQASASKLFFLKHACRERNEGVSVHWGVEACHAAWSKLPREEQGDYVAQEEVANVLLDQEGRKITLRIYLLLLFDGHSSDALLLARRDFVGRSHPCRYDAKDPDPQRHVHSTLEVFKDVDGFCSQEWPHTKSIWPAVMRMFQADDGC